MAWGGPLAVSLSTVAIMLSDVAELAVVLFVFDSSFSLELDNCNKPPKLMAFSIS